MVGFQLKIVELSLSRSDGAKALSNFPICRNCSTRLPHSSLRLLLQALLPTGQRSPKAHSFVSLFLHRKPNSPAENFSWFGELMKLQDSIFLGFSLVNLSVNLISEMGFWFVWLGWVLNVWNYSAKVCDLMLLLLWFYRDCSLLKNWLCTTGLMRVYRFS